ncbi:YojF family protein [Peribacillus deserti]|uniref:DUF1806 domain-containing protein n=1 Tax=Peribacillus deserti TaxID=673318 RepID=A0A2N5M7J6_9BACI|nr:YojF family protein [Peribacillus deserti]PLT30263.1 DUF1806 domain-containing protein [Peribacillus deserti]
MEPIIQADVQALINSYANEDVYLHLETTNGAYATHFDESFFSVGAYIRNAFLQYELGKIVGMGPYRVGLKLSIGWVYAEGLTHYEQDAKGRLLMAGLDPAGKLAVALQISKTPFE